jgi:outer membrane protein assembly factor BamB
MLRSLTFVWLVFALTAWTAGQFRFVHTTDTHVNPHRTEDSNASRNERMFREISALDPRPALALNTGDVVEVGSAMEYGYLREALAAMAVPYYHAPGNHDVRWNPLGKEGFVRGTGQPLFQRIDAGGIHFFLLDSTVLLEHWGHISRQQLDWLKTELEKIGPDAPVVIGFHHWVGRERVQVDNEQELIDLVEPYNVVLWLQGHGHSDLLWNVNGTPAVMQKGLYQGSYAVIDVADGRLTISRRAQGKASANELVRDKSVPTTQPGEWTTVGAFPLRRPPAPKWGLRTGFDDGHLVITALRGDLPADATLGFRINAGEFTPMNPAGPDATALTNLDDLIPGNHIVSVEAKLPDGRAYRRRRTVTVHADRVKPAWETQLGGAVQSRLVRAGDAVYVTTMAGELASLDAQTGAARWTFRAGDSIFSTPHVEGEMVYVGSADHRVYAVRRSDGTPAWSFKTDGAVLAGAAVANGVVCIGSADTAVYGLDAATGSVRWKVQGGNLFQSKAATDGRQFFVGGWDNYFRCIDAATGREEWKVFLGREQRMLPQFSAFAPAIASPAVASDLGLVFVSTNDGILHALRTSDGSSAWTIDRKKMGYSSPLYRDGVVYGCLSDESRVFAVDATTGAMRWETETGRVVYDSSFAWVDGQVVIGAVDGTVLAFDAETGAARWQYRLDHGHLLASPAADDSYVYIASMLGRVVAIPAR